MQVAGVKQVFYTSISYMRGLYYFLLRNVDT